MKRSLFSCALVAWYLVLSLHASASSPIFTPERVPVLGDSWQAPGESFSFAILGDKTSGGEGKWPIFDQAVAEGTHEDAVRESTAESQQLGVSGVPFFALSDCASPLSGAQTIETFRAAIDAKLEETK